MKYKLLLALAGLTACGSADKPEATTAAAAPSAVSPAPTTDNPDPHQVRVISLHRYYRETDSMQTVRVEKLKADQYPGLAAEQKTVAAHLAKAKDALDQLDQLVLQKPVDEAEFNKLRGMTDNALGQAKVAGLMALEQNTQNMMMRPKKK